jgi:hypothetical protein
MEVTMKAFTGILIAAVWISPLRAQDTTRATNAMPDSANATRLTDSAAATAEAHPYRNPREALILGSVFPGAGHIYAGEYWHGVVNYEMTVMTIGMGVMTFTLDRCTFSNLDFLSPSNCDPGPKWPYQALGVALVGLGFRQWILSARDASRAAERANERHRRTMSQVKPIIEPAGGSHGWHAGIEIPW